MPIRVPDKAIPLPWIYAGWLSELGLQGTETEEEELITKADRLAIAKDRSPFCIDQSKQALVVSNKSV